MWTQFIPGLLEICLPFPHRSVSNPGVFFIALLKLYGAKVKVKMATPPAQDQPWFGVIRSPSRSLRIGHEKPDSAGKCWQCQIPSFLPKKLNHFNDSWKVKYVLRSPAIRHVFFNWAFPTDPLPKRTGFHRPKFHDRTLRPGQERDQLREVEEVMRFNHLKAPPLIEKKTKDGTGNQQLHMETRKITMGKTKGKPGTQSSRIATIRSLKSANLALAQGLHWGSNSDKDFI